MARQRLGVGRHGGQWLASDTRLNVHMGWAALSRPQGGWPGKRERGRGGERGGGYLGREGWLEGTTVSNPSENSECVWGVCVWGGGLLIPTMCD